MSQHGSEFIDEDGEKFLDCKDEERYENLNESINETNN